jgi:ATP-dependent helicase/nuclease subunit B
MTASDIATAFAAGACVVTPNNRLARHLVARHDAAQVAAGRRAWPAARAMPWQGFLTSLWLDALGAGVMHSPRHVVADGAAAHLWDRIVRNAPQRLQDPHGAAMQALEAWRVFHAWRHPGEHLDGWAHSGIEDDAAAFAQWAASYRVVLDGGDFVDSALLPDWLADIAPRMRAWRELRVVTTGFAAMTPQQQRLFDALRAAGATVGTMAGPGVAAARLRRVVCATPTDEFAHALAWARECALAAPAASIGLVVEDLAACREEIVALADDILSPALAVRVAPDAMRPFDASLGTPLSAVPVVAAALDLIMLAGAPLPAADAAALLRSPFLAGAQRAWSQRARGERMLREWGLRRAGLTDVIHVLADVDPALGDRWRSARALAHGPRSPRHWVDEWRTWLAAAGWPGDATPGSSEWQAREAWSKLLHQFGTFAAVSPMLGRDDAVAALRAVASATMWEPEAPPARIRILGVLEASGLSFDALWLAGFTDERWPRSPAPNAMLPLSWQRERDVPRANAAGELAYARALTAGFAGAAREVIASHARDADGVTRAGSALMAHWPEMDMADLPAPARHADAIAGGAGPLSTCEDDRAPGLPPGSAISGGTGVIESQSACPFQAFALHRLRASTLPAESEGLTAQERGKLLHAALAAFWNDIHDHATLVALSADRLSERIATAVADACAGIDRRRAGAIPAAVTSGEAPRLAATIRAWLDLIERERPAFAVVATESEKLLALGGIVLRFRLDRIDRLEGGGLAIIDYKSGRAVAPGKWFAQRPSGNQAGLYALACLAEGDAAPVRAVACAQLKAGQIGLAGLAADAGAWPALPVLAQLRNAPGVQWSDATEWWARRHSALAADFRNGEAAVAPRDAACCRLCELQPLCRIRALGDEFPADDGGRGA